MFDKLDRPVRFTCPRIDQGQGGGSIVPFQRTEVPNFNCASPFANGVVFAPKKSVDQTQIAIHSAVVRRSGNELLDLLSRGNERALYASAVAATRNPQQSFFHCFGIWHRGPPARLEVKGLRRHHSEKSCRCDKIALEHRDFESIKHVVLLRVTVTASRSLGGNLL